MNDKSAIFPCQYYKCPLFSCHYYDLINFCTHLYFSYTKWTFLPLNFKSINFKIIELSKKGMRFMFCESRNKNQHKALGPTNFLYSRIFACLISSIISLKKISSVIDIMPSLKKKVGIKKSVEKTYVPIF